MTWKHLLGKMKQIVSPNTSENGWIAAQRGWVRARVHISPLVSFGTLVEVISKLVGKPLEETGRFDEFPGVTTDVDNHEVNVFGLPRSDAIGPDWMPCYSIDIYPDYPENHPLEDMHPRNVSMELIDALRPLLPDCELTLD